MKPTLGEKIRFRLERARLAFDRALKPIASPQVCKEAIEVGTVVGWLIRVDGAVLPVSELVKGGQWLRFHRDGFERTTEGQGLYVVVRKAECMIGETKVYHGDTITLEGVAYVVRLLPSRAYVQWLASLAALFILPHLGTAEEATIVSAQGEPPRALYRSRLDMVFSIPGLVDPKTLLSGQAFLRTGAAQHRLPIRTVQSPKVHYTFLVDIGGLCLKFDREEAINRDIRQLIERAPRPAWVSVLTYYRSDQIAMQRVLNNVPIEQLQEGEATRPSEFIQCRSQVESVNVFDAISQARKYFAETDAWIAGLPQANAQRSSEDVWRRVLLAYTPGNVRHQPLAEQVIQDFDLDIYPVVYSNFKSPFAERALETLTSLHEGKTRWWNEGPTSLVDWLPFPWTVGLDVHVPFGLEEKPYPVEIQLKQLKLRGEVQYFRDPRAYFLYRAGVILALIVVTVGTFVGVRRVWNYYRTPVCRRTKQLLSHTWNQSLFAALGRAPVLLVTSGYGYERAFVIEAKRVKVGRQWGSGLRLYSPFVEDRTPFLIERIGYESFLISRRTKKQSEPFVLSGLKRKEPMFLKHGDVFCFGEYTIMFLNPPEIKGSVAV